jgi:6-phosphofructokinase 1
MKSQPINIGLCTGGGDCPGLNAAIRAVVRSATLVHNMRVVGLRHGLTGLNTPKDAKPLDLDSVEHILDRGGTILGTNNQGSPFRNEQEAHKTIELMGRNWRKLKLDGLIVIGGDGTQFMAKKLANAGFPIIGIPKTIDNDLVGTDQTIGFATAVEIASDAASRLGTSAEAHNRIMVLEVMGRDGGHIALATALASGAHAALLPEIPFSWETLTTAFKNQQIRGLNHMLVVAAEGATPIGGQPLFATSVGGGKVLGGIGSQIAQTLHAQCGADARVAVLGHVQRGGGPNVADKLLATTLGSRAVAMAAAKEFGGIVGVRGGKPVTIPYQTLTAKRRLLDLDDEMIIAAESTGLSLGR